MQVLSRAEYRFTATGTSGTQSITSVNHAKAVVKVTYSFDSSPTTFTPDQFQVRFWLSNATTLNWARDDDTDGTTVQVTAEVVLYGDDTTVQIGSTTLSGSTSTTASPSSVTTSQSWIYSTQSTDSSAAGSEEGNPAQAFVGVELTNSTTITFRKGNSTASTTTQWYLISSSTLSVQRGSLGITSTSGNTTTISSVTLSQTFLFGTYQSAEVEYVNDEGAIYCDLQNSTTVRGRVGFAGATNTYYYQVVSDSAQSVQTFGDSVANSATGSDSPSSIDESLSFVLPTVGTNGGAANDSNYQSGFSGTRMIEHWISAATTVSWRRSDGVSDTHKFRQVIEQATALEWEQEGYRWFDDDGDEDESTALAAQDTSITVAKQTTVRLRGLLNVSTGNPGSVVISVEWKKSGDPDSQYRLIPLVGFDSGFDSGFQ